MARRLEAADDDDEEEYGSSINEDAELPTPDSMKARDDARANRLSRIKKLAAAAVALLATSMLASAVMRDPRIGTELVSWNIAAINNNPFEYWITHDDPAYNKLMADVQQFIDAPGERDVPVRAVFTPSMWSALEARMATEGWSTAETKAVWESDFSSRTIVSGFLKDRSIGSKRLASMPDRYTNTIRTVSGVKCRPTVINCYDGDLRTLDGWWEQWARFMFAEPLRLRASDATAKTPAKMLRPIMHSKYPAISETEEAYSLPLQTLSAAIFDAILVHIVNTVSPTGRWQSLRGEMCDALNRKKDDHTLSILEREYGHADALFLQETATSFMGKVRESSLGAKYLVVTPEGRDPSRDQNSAILLRRDRFVAASVREVTAEVAATLAAGGESPIAAGDLLVVAVKDALERPFLLASFHGDTNGLATKPVFGAVAALAARMPDHTLLFGMDANTYETGSADKQGVADFAADFRSKGYTSCWGDAPDPHNHTTFNARTYLQPQLQKAAKASELVAKGDKNPKDMILFPKGVYAVASTTKDNTGQRRYVENMVFPTLAFPSDHGILSTVLVEADGGAASTERRAQRTSRRRSVGPM